MRLWNSVTMKDLLNSAITTFVLLFLIVLVFFASFSDSREYDVPYEINLSQFRDTSNVVFEDDVLVFDSLSLRQKLAQLFIIYESDYYAPYYRDMMIGGLLIGAKPTFDAFVINVSEYQRGATVPFLMTADLEGCLSPTDAFYPTKNFAQIDSEEDAFALGVEHGELLNRLGVHMNFAPVVDIGDSIWKCRSFPGDAQQVSSQSAAYISGLQSTGTYAVAKHYPGSSLTQKDPHKHFSHALVTSDDLLPFTISMDANVSGIMVTHTIAEGFLNSGEKPSVVSSAVIDPLRTEFRGVLITDDMQMLGVRNFYESDSQMFVETLQRGYDLIIYLDYRPEYIAYIINELALAVERGEISESQIDISVKKNLDLKKVAYT